MNCCACILLAGSGNWVRLGQCTLCSVVLHHTFLSLQGSRRLLAVAVSMAQAVAQAAAAAGNSSQVRAGPPTPRRVVSDTLTGCDSAKPSSG